MLKIVSVVATTVATTLFLTSCSLFEVSYGIDEQADFTRYRTFSWYSDGSAESIRGLFGVDAAKLDAAIRETIQHQLQTNGLTLAQAENSADILLNYQAIAKTVASDRYHYSIEDMEQSYIRKQISYSSSFDASRRFTTVYDEGTFIVDVIDNNRLHVVWRGTVETPIGLYDSENRRIQRMQKAIIKLLRPFPPK